MAEQTIVPEKTSTAPLRRWDPFEVLTELQEEMANRWGHSWPVLPWAFTRRPTAPAEGTAWAPSIDIYEKDGELVVKAELPGVKKEDIAVELAEGSLVIRGERKAEHEVKEQDYYRMERSYGTFQRRVRLPFEVKPEQIEAKYSDGVLEVHLPKPKEERPQPQKVTVA